MPVDTGEKIDLSSFTFGGNDDATLRRELEKHQSRRNEFQIYRNFAPITGLLFLITGYIISFYMGLNKIWMILGLLYFTISVGIFIAPITGSIDARINAIKDEIELISLDVTDVEQRAERLYKTHEIELKRYYSQVLSHSSMIFYIGVFCILFGFTIISFSVYKLWLDSGTLSNIDKILPAVFGLVSGVLTNFVGAIFLKMFTSISSSLGVFHERLVETHKTYYSNFLISKISDKEARERLIGELAFNHLQAAGEVK